MFRLILNSKILFSQQLQSIGLGTFFTQHKVRSRYVVLFDKLIKKLAKTAIPNRKNEIILLSCLLTEPPSQKKIFVNILSPMDLMSKLLNSFRKLKMKYILIGYFSIRKKK